MVLQGDKLALVTCGECGQQVSDRALFCPKCGNPEIINAAADQPVLPPPAAAVSALDSTPPKRVPSAEQSQAPADGLASLRFKQSKHQRNRPRSVWPKVILACGVLGVGYFSYQYAPTLIASFGGAPSGGQVATLLKETLSGSLSVNDYKVPAKFVDIYRVNVRTVEAFDKRGDAVLYRATGDALARLTASGEVIGKDVEGQIGRNAQRHNFRSAIDAVYSRFQAHSAMADVPQGSEYPLHFDVIIRVVDGNLVLVRGNVSSGS